MAHIGSWVRSGVGLGLILGLVVPSLGAAQAGKSARQLPKMVTEIEEITVTAQKREENIQEIPISVTALTGDTLAQKGATSLTALTESVPNLYVKQAAGGPGNIIISMRGASQANPTLEQNPSVGLYVDGVYIAKIYGANLDLEDLDRIEVLRGPQGTLYGKNTIGGTVNLITRKPTETRAVTVQTEVGNYNAFKGRATLNLPLIGRNGFFQSALGTLSLRQNVVYRSRDGFYRNQSPTTVKASGPSELSDLNRVLTMTSLRWVPSKAVTVDYAFEYHRYRQAPTAWQTTFLYPGSLVSGRVPPLDLRPYVREQRVDAIGYNALLKNDLKSTDRFADDGNNRMHLLTATWELGNLGPLGNVTVKSLSGYRSLAFDANSDLDGSPLRITDFYVAGDIRHWSEELQWIGTGPRIRYVLGAYYYGERFSHGAQQVIFGGGANINFKNIGDTDSYAPFGQFTWTPPVLGDRLTLTAGLRYTIEQVHMTRDYRCLAASCRQGVPGIESFVRSVGKGFSGTDGLTPMGNIAYQWTDELMTYFRVSRGFRSGNANGGASDVRLFTLVNPEKLLQYEAGFKSQWFDNRLRLNADGFFSDYTDQAVNVFRASPTGAAVTSVENAGSSEYWGTELEILAVPFRGLEVTLNYAYLNAKWTEWVAQKFDPTGRPIFDEQGRAVLENVADSRDVNYAPENTLTVGLTYTAPSTSMGTLSAHVDTYWQDKTRFQTTRPHYNAGWSYAVVNGRLQFVDIPLQNGTLDVAVFGHNLFDRKYRIHGIDFGAGLGFAGNFYGDKRTFGLQLTYNFAEL